MSSINAMSWAEASRRGCSLRNDVFVTGRFLWNHLGLPCLNSRGRKVMEGSMFRKIVIALVAAAVIAFVPTGAFARGGFGGFGGGGFHTAGFGGGGWRGGGWRGGGWGGGWRGAGWRGGGSGWRGPAFGALGVGLGLGLAGAYAASSGPGWGWGPGWDDGGDPCVRWRQVWTGWGWRVVPVNVCW